MGLGNIDKITPKKRRDSDLSMSAGSRLEQAMLIQRAIDALRDYDKHTLERCLTRALSEAVRNAADSQRLDWLQDNCEVVVSTNTGGRELFGFNAQMSSDFPALRELIDAQILSKNTETRQSANGNNHK